MDANHDEPVDKDGVAAQVGRPEWLRVEPLGRSGEGGQVRALE